MDMDRARSALFRKAALDRLSSPEQLDRMVTITDPQGWIAALGVAAMLGFLVAWGVLGRIPTEVTAPGILVAQGGRVVNAVSTAGGVIEHLGLSVGDQVAKGQAVADIRQTEAGQRLVNARQLVEQRAQELAQRRQGIAREAAVRRDNGRLRRLALQEVVKTGEQQVGVLQTQLGQREAMLAQQLTTGDRVEQTRSALNQARQSVSDARAKLAEVDAGEIQADQADAKELTAMADAVAEARRAVTEIESHLAETSTVLAPAAGRVTEIAVVEGATVAPGGIVLSIETQGRRLQAVVYVPTDQGKRVATGMAARIAPATVKKEEYGTVQGGVVAVAAFPTTPQGMQAVLQNAQLATSFAAGGSPYEARLDLTPADTPSGYAWTSGRGPALDLTSGTTVEAQITLRQDAPIDLVLPFLRGTLGLER